MSNTPDDRLGSGLSILVVDDDSAVQEFLGLFLEEEGFDVVMAGTIAESRRLAAGHSFDLLLLDKNLPDGSGLDYAREVAGQNRDCETLMMSAYATVDSTVQAIQLGVADFIVKPVSDIRVLRTRLQRVIELQRLRRANARLVQDLKQKTVVLESLVVRDPLTALYNHAHFQDCVNREIGRSERHGLQFSVLFIDVDDFKSINDANGHLLGDDVLKRIAGLLRAGGRVSDLQFRLRSEDVAARYGGDEFAVVLPNTPKGGAAAKAEAMRACIEQSEFGARGLQPTVSVGVAGYPDDGRDRRSLLAAADASLYAAKSRGRNRVVSYSPSLTEVDSNEYRLRRLSARQVEGLAETITGQRVDFVYQPIVGFEERRAVAYEALCRPTHEAFENPGVLIAAAESVGRIRDLGVVMRTRALAPLASLPDGVSLFVNLHPLELGDPRLYQPPPDGFERRIVFEITEASQIQNYDTTRAQLGRLRELGYRIAIDDLGAGYAGLNSLALLAPDFVKLDMALVRNIDADGSQARLIGHILEYAHGEGMEVIAEGIETEEELQTVLDLGCRLVQGYYLGRPTAPFAEVPPALLAAL